MKLRNKKTGEIVEREEFILIKHIEGDGGWQDGSYYSIAELNKNWEDVAEPLIKDENDPERAEKIRKAVRTWAEVLHIDRDNIKVSIGSHRTSIVGWQPGLIGGYSIDFPNILNELHDGMQTTIAELCGEEQE